MDTLRLRTLTKKSTLNFGKHADLTVGLLIDLRNTVYLRWCYFNCSMISFNSEVLRKINIPEDFEIEKPGKNPEKHIELCDILQKKIPGFEKFKKKQHKKRCAKSRYISEDIKDRKYFSKGNLQRINHGR